MWYFLGVELSMVIGGKGVEGEIGGEEKRVKEGIYYINTGYRVNNHYRVDFTWVCGVRSVRGNEGGVRSVRGLGGLGGLDG